MAGLPKYAGSTDVGVAATGRPDHPPLGSRRGAGGQEISGRQAHLYRLIIRWAGKSAILAPRGALDMFEKGAQWRGVDPPRLYGHPNVEA